MIALSPDLLYPCLVRTIETLCSSTIPKRLPIELLCGHAVRIVGLGDQKFL